MSNSADFIVNRQSLPITLYPLPFTSYKFVTLPPIKNPNTEAERYVRLLRLYEEFLAEVDALERDGHALHRKLTSHMDKTKIKETLEQIVEH